MLKSHQCLLFAMVSDPNPLFWYLMLSTIWLHAASPTSLVFEAIYLKSQAFSIALQILTMTGSVLGALSVPVDRFGLSCSSPCMVSSEPGVTPGIMSLQPFYSLTHGDSVQIIELLPQFLGTNENYVVCLPRSNKFLLRKLDSALWNLRYGQDSYYKGLIIENQDATPYQTLSVLCHLDPFAFMLQKPQHIPLSTSLN